MQQRLLIDAGILMDAGAAGASDLVLDAPSRRALARAAERWSRHFGAGSRSELERTSAAELSARAPRTEEEARDICADVERRLSSRHGRAALDAELRDEREKASAEVSDGALVLYEQKWSRRLARMQRAYPERWRVAGWSAEETQGALSLSLLELVRARTGFDPRVCRAGKEWGLLVLHRALRELQRRHRVDATPMELDGARLMQHTGSQEEHWLVLEAEACRARAAQSARDGLSRTQLRWLDALESSAARGEFFEASAEPNLSAASRELGKHRSSAQRAYRELSAHFRRELARVR